MSRPEDMWRCQTVNCGYVYDPDRGDRKGKIPKGTRFEDLPDEWRCPVCGASKRCFKPVMGPGSVTGCETPIIPQAPSAAFDQASGAPAGAPPGGKDPGKG